MLIEQLWSGNMKHINRATMLLIVVILISIPFKALAIDTGLATESLTEDEKIVISEQRVFEKLTAYTPISANCFDVRSDQMIVIGAKTGESAIIAVYSDDGLFQYGFQTKEPGSFRIMWSGDAIAYYSIRSGLLYKINDDGEITDIFRVPSTTENSIYEQKTLSAFTRQVGNSTYHMTNGNIVIDALSTSFNKIIKTDTGIEAVIYDASNNQRARIIGGLVVFALLSTFIVCRIIWGIKKHYNKLINKRK